MTLGIRSCSAFKMVEEAASGGLPAEQVLLANSYRNPNSYRSRFASENPFASTVLHEVQHYLQYKTNIDTPQYRLLGKVFQARRESFANMTGMWRILPEDLSGFNTSGGGPEAYMMMKYGNLFKKATESEGKLATPENILAIANSPFFKSINGRAGHLVRSAYQTMYGFLAEELDAKRLSPSYGDKLRALTAASLTATMGGDGMLNFYNHLVDLHEGLSRDSQNFRSNFPIHDEFFMVKHALGAISDLDILDASDPVHFGATVKSMTDHLAMMDYNLVSHERMARETQRRAGMTQEELLATPRVSMEDPKVLRESKSNDAIVDIINTAIAKGEANSGAFNSIMKSIGGIGERSSQDSAILEGLGKLSLLSVHVHKAWNAIDAARAIAVTAQGWYLDGEGRVRLKNGRYILRGKNFDEVQKTLQAKNIASKMDGESVLDVNQSYIQGSYTIEDLANLADVVVESRMETTVGNALVDAVLSPAFPATVKADMFLGELAKVHVPSEDAAYAANLTAIADVLQGHGDITLTKNDLANMIIFYHRTFSENFEQGGAGANIYARGAKSVDLAAAPRERKIAALISNNTTRLAESAIAAATGVPETQGFRSLRNHPTTGETLTSKYGFGRFTMNNHRIEFSPTPFPPKWVQELGDEAVAKWIAKSESISKNLLDRASRRVFTNANEAGEFVDRMNTRIANKLLLLEPVLDRAINMIKSDTELASPVDKINFAMGLLDEMSLAQERIAFGTLPLEAVKKSTENRILEQGTLPVSGVSPTDATISRVQSKLGGFRKDMISTGFGDIGSLNMNASGYDPFSNFSASHENPHNLARRPMGMLSFMAGAIMNMDDAQGVSTSTALSGFGVSGMYPHSVNTELSNAGWVEATGRRSPIGTLSESARDIGQYHRGGNGLLFWGQMQSMFSDMTEAISTQRDNRRELKDLVNTYIDTYNKGTKESTKHEEALSAALTKREIYFTSQQEALNKIVEGLDMAEAQRLLQQLELEDAKVPREREVLDILGDIVKKRNIAEKPSMMGEVEKSMNFSNLSRRYYAGYSEPLFPISGTQAAMVDGVAVFNVASFSADSSAQQAYKVHGGFGAQVPSIVRSRVTNATHAAEISVYHGLFANIVNSNNDTPEHGRRNVNTDRLSIFHNVAIELADLGISKPNENFSISDGTNPNLSHLLGGSVLSIFSIVLEAANKEDISVVDYAARFPLIQQISDGTPYAETIPSPIGNLSSKTQSGTQHHSSLLGIAAAVPLATILNRGYMGWHKNGTLGLVVPEAITGSNFLRAAELARESREGGTKGLLRNEEFLSSVQKFVEQLTSEDISRLALECTSHANSATVATMMAFLNTWGLTKEQTQRTVGNASIAEALSTGLASGVHFRLAGHPSVPEKVGIPKESIARLTQIFKETLKHESFWLGYFAAHHGMDKGDFRFPITTANSPNEGMSNVNMRSSVNADRGVGYVHTNLPASRFSIDGGHAIDAETTFPMEGIVNTPTNNNRSNITDFNFAQWRSFIAKTDEQAAAIGDTTSLGTGVSFRGLHDYADSFDYGTFFSQPTAGDSVNTRSFFKHIPNDYEFVEGVGFVMQVWNEGKAEYEKVLRSDQPSQDVSNRQVMTQAKEYSRGLRRKIMTNMIINAAEQMGVSEVGVQPARFSASAKPDRHLAMLTTTEAREQLVYEKPLVMHTNAFAGRAIISTGIRGSGMQGEVAQNGFSWQRLPDGRIMVNYTPHVGIASSFDMSTDSKYNGLQPLGINLRRTIGWDHTKGGLLIPQSFVRTHGLIENNSRVVKYTKQQGVTERSQAIQMLQDRLEKLTAYDPLYLEHAHIASARVAKNVDFGQNLTGHVESGSMQIPMGTFATGLKEYIEGLLGGSNYALHSSTEGFRANLEHASSILSMNSPENSYYTFILPKNFREEHLHEAISSVALAHHSESLGLSSLESREIYRQGQTAELMGMRKTSYNPFLHEAGGEAISSALNRSLSVAVPELSPDRHASFVLPYEFKRNDGGTGNGARHLTDATAKFFSHNSVRNPLFLSNITSLHERISAQEKGYFLPENERSVTTNGDRIAVIDALFPNRPDLRQFAWDDNSKNNLTVFRKSDKSGYVVGYDIVTGMDSAGVPVRRRMTRTFRTESEATAHGNEVSSKSILAELPNIMAREGSIRTKILSTKPQADAKVYEKIALSPDNSGFTDSGVYGVGNMNVSFATEAEAKAFRDVLLTPEIIAGVPKARETIMLSVKGISELEQDVKNTINFGTMGSLYAFGSNLMKAINSGLVRDRAGKKEFKDAYTGKDWYDLFVSNGASKMEMRTSGVVEYLYSNKDNMLSRQDLAEFTFALYPRMGRQILTGTPSQTTVLGNMTIPNSLSPKGLFDNSMAPYAGHLLKVMELTKHEIPGNHPEIYKGVQNAMLDAFRDAYASIYGRENANETFKTIEDVWSAFDQQRLGKEGGQGTAGENILGNSTTLKPIVTPQIGEMMRIGFNDFIAKAKLEHATELAGMPLEMPDTLTGYDNPMLRPSYAHLPTLAHAPSEDVAISTGGMLGRIRGSNAWPEYTSGIGPYSVDVLSGHFVTSEVKDRAIKYRSEIESRIARLETSTPDTPERSAEVQRLRNMQDAVKRVIEIRQKIADTSGNLTSGHWRSPDGSIQYGHARYSFGAASLATLPLEELQPLYGKMQNPQGVMLPLLYIEEVQSDIFQKNTFATPARGDLRLATDFKQAEATALFSELDEIKKRMAYLSADKQTTLEPLKEANRLHFRTTALMHKVSFMREITRMGRVERYAFLEAVMAQNSSNRLGRLKVREDGVVVIENSEVGSTDTGIRVDNSKKLKIGNALADRLAISNEIPDVVFGPDGASMLADALIAIHAHNDNNIGLPQIDRHYLASHVALEAMGFNITDKVPNTGDVVDFKDLAKRAESEDTQMVVSMKSLQVASVVDEGFQASIREIAKNALLDDRTGHSFDYDALAVRIRDKFLMKLNDPSLAPEKRRSLRIVVNDVSAAIESPEDYSPMVKHYRPVEDSSMSIRANPANDWSYENYDRLKIDQFLTTKYIYSVPTSGHAYIQKTSTSQMKTHQKYAAMTPARAHRMFVEQLKAMDTNLGENKKNHVIEAAERLAMVYETEEAGVEVGPSSWKSAHESFINIMHNDYFPNRNKAIFAVTGDALEPLGHTPWSWSSNAVAEKSKSRTAAGKQLEHFLSPTAIALDRLMPNDQLDQLRLKKQEIEKILQIDPNAADSALSDSIPLGEDGSYRTLMMQYYTMRALQSQRNYIAFADARHHRNRYQGNSSVFTTFFLGPNMPVASGMGGDGLHRNYIINQAALSNPDGFLMAMATKGLHTMSPVKSGDSMLVTFNGTTALIADHAMTDINKFYQEKLHSTSDELAEASRTAVRNHVHKAFRQTVTVHGSSMHLYDYVTRHGATGLNADQIGQMYLNTYGGEEGGNMYKRVAKLAPAPATPFLSKPYARTNGYTANYGTPKWNTSIYYSGMPEAFIDGLSNDAFQRPLVALGEDGTYTLSDPKTNKPIMSGIKTEELTERIAQNSKYLGKSPMITPFIKSFGRAGAYVMDGSIFANRNLSHTVSGDLMNSLSDVQGSKITAIKGNIGMESNQVISPQIGGDVFSKINPQSHWSNDSSSTGLRGNAVALVGSPAGESHPDMTFMMAAMYATGLRKGASSDEIAAAIAKVGSFSSPILVIKPKYPTASHIVEMKKILADGIPLMSVKGIGGEQAAVSGAIRGFKFYATPPAQQQDERN